MSYRTNSPQRVLQLHQAANAQAKLSSSKRTLVLEQGWQPEKAMHRPFSDRFAKAQTTFFRFIADRFFAKRYGHRAVVLETIAGVPGMVAGMWVHLKSLRQMRTGYGPMIRELLAEAENERMHLMFFIEIAQPNVLERWLILAAQAVFWNYYFALYLCSPKTAHLMVHYFEKEAVKSYTSYLQMVDEGLVENVKAPRLAIDYYGLADDARLSDLIRCVRADELRHSLANAKFADSVVARSAGWRAGKRKASAQLASETAEQNGRERKDAA